jgi:malate dehydrogenase
MNKIAIIGSGRVGEAAAWLIAQRGLCEELALLEIVPGLAAGVALDIQQAAPLQGFHARVSGSQQPDILRDSEIVIITAGASRRPGMARMDLQAVNVRIMETVFLQIREHAPQAMLLVVTNPADVITYHVWRRSALPRQRVMGFSGVLDSSRMAHFLARAAGLKDDTVAAMVIGGHGDSMVPLVSQARVNGVPVGELLDPAQLEEVIRRTRRAGTEILNLKEPARRASPPPRASPAWWRSLFMIARKHCPSSACWTANMACTGWRSASLVSSADAGSKASCSSDLRATSNGSSWNPQL